MIYFSFLLTNSHKIGPIAFYFKCLSLRYIWNIIENVQKYIAFVDFKI